MTEEGGIVMVDDAKKVGPASGAGANPEQGDAEAIAGISELQKALADQEKLRAEVDRVSHELKEFAYIVSHDLKAPLRAIKTLVDWISTDYADKLDDEGRDQMKLLVNRVDRMHRLLEGVLEYSRIGRICEPPARVNLNEVVPELIEDMDVPDSVLVTVEDPLPVIETEPGRIRQVFEHLIANAVHFTDKPQGFIRIHAAEQGDAWVFSVTDNGCGIREEHYERIFKIFQTLVAKDQSESAGMGLALVKKIVEFYGGRVWVESVVGQGSTFFFTWPKVLAAERALAEAAV
jgi:light-regulated signal transduction histidine kinase (bacteriophytochrome)